MLTRATTNRYHNMWIRKLILGGIYSVSYLKITWENHIKPKMRVTTSNVEFESWISQRRASDAGSRDLFKISILNFVNKYKHRL